MEKKLVFIAMYCALDCLLDKIQRKDSGDYLTIEQKNQS